MDEKRFNTQIIEWAQRFGFRIDGEYVIFTQSDVDALIEALNAEFAKWGKKEKLKSK